MTGCAQIVAITSLLAMLLAASVVPTTQPVAPYGTHMDPYVYVGPIWGHMGSIWTHMGQDTYCNCGKSCPKWAPPDGRLRKVIGCAQIAAITNLLAMFRPVPKTG